MKPVSVLITIEQGGFTVTYDDGSVKFVDREIDMSKITPEMNEAVNQDFDLIQTRKSEMLNDVAREAEARQANSFEYDGKRVRATAADYDALVTFTTLFNSDHDWNPERMWFGTEGFDTVPLKTVEDAQQFAATMVEHKEKFIVAMLHLNGAIRAATTVESLAKIKPKDDKNWPE